LLVVDFEIPPGEEIQQLAIIPELTDSNPGPRTRWSDLNR
jgi:hypothetical protein